MIGMWECKYGKEPLNTRLFVLQLLRKLPVILLAGILGALFVGGPYFLVKVAFGPAKEYEAVTDFYIDYALQADGTQHTYINFATWDQLLKDDVFTDRILFYMAGENAFADGEAGQPVPFSAVSPPLPPHLLTAFAVKVYDGGPILYKQVRCTLGGREFKIMKFRSMSVDAEKDGKARLASKNDVRITPVGKFIRVCRLDELPQLFNILKGEMSFIGPRPE